MTTNGAPRNRRRHGHGAARSYSQYCPIAHALDLVGERWALLVVRELLNGPLRYTDLAERLPGIGTNVLASRLRDLEAGGVIRKRRLPPPAASQVYELTEHGAGLDRVLYALARWGARTMGPPGDGDELYPGWLENALRAIASVGAPAGSFEFHVDEEVASLVDGEVHHGPAEKPDIVLETDGAGFYHLFAEGDFGCVEAQGDRRALERLVAAVALPSAEPVQA
jgi:DNA-binding HxlR family transcriptional regulator